MKKTNVALLSFAARMAKFLPVLLCFIFLSSSDLVAQNYKPLEDAQMSVKQALEDFEDDVISFDMNASEVTQTDQENVQKQRVFKKFLKLSAEMHSVDDAVEAMAPDIVWQKHQEPYRSVLRVASEELMDLITE